MSSPPPHSNASRKSPQAVRRTSTAEATAARPRFDWRRHRVLAAGLTVVGALGAALILPGFAGASLQSAHADRIELQLAVPPAMPSVSEIAASDAPERNWQVIQVSRGQTLGAIFDRLGL